MNTDTPPSPSLRRVLRVLDYIHDHADEDLSLDQLAEVAALSRFHWHRVFKAMMGRSPADVIRSVRMHKASMLLVQTPLSIAEIGPRVGYPNPRSFARTFQAAYGKTPSAFRAAAQNATRISPLIGDLTMYTVTIEDRDPTRMAAMAHKGAYPEISRAFQRLAAILDDGGHWPLTRGMIAVFYDDPESTLAEDLRSHAGAVWAGAEMPQGLEDITLQGGRYAKLTFKGPYSGLPNAYGYLYGAWLAEAQVTPADAPSFEVYLNSPMDTAPEALLTEIYMPISTD